LERMSKKVDYDFIVEYAKSNQSSCHTSKEKIAKGSVRIGQMVPSPRFDGKIPQWHDLKWFFVKGNKGLTQWEMLHGRDSLRFEDQEKVKKLIAEHGGADDGGGGMKRKADGDPAGESKAKKLKTEEKEETPEEKARREESKLLWDIKDALDGLQTRDIKEILELNDQSQKGGRPDLIARVAEGMMFGIVKECDTEDCSGGHVYYDKATGKYRCTGQPSEWAQCLFEADQADVKVSAYKLPDENWRKKGFFKTWKFTKRTRAVEKSVIVRAEVTEDAHGVAEEQIKAARLKRKFFDIGKKNEKPFTGYLISFTGKLSETQGELEKIVTSLGGKVSKTISPANTHLITTEAAVKKAGGKIDDAYQYDVPMMSEDWLHESSERGEFLNQKDYLIGGSEKAKNILTREFSDPAEEEKREAAAATSEKKVKLVMKGRCAVDPSAGDDVIEDYHVLDLGGTNIYNVVLNVTDISKGVNSYYGLQILEHDKKKNKYIVFRKWGRVGGKQGGTKLEKFDDREDAEDNFKEVYLDKTGNKWKDRDNFKKKPGKFFPIEIDYSGLDKKKEKTDVQSKLDVPLQNLMSLIFDIKIMEQSLAAMEIDLKKMPLGNLSKKHIQSGYEVLRNIDACLKDDKQGERKKAASLLAFSNQFYTLIPHDFGTKDPTIIDSLEQLQVKMKLMEALIDIEIAATLMKQEGAEGVSQLDINYKKLNTELTTVATDDPDFKMCQTYLSNQKGHYNAELCDLWKVAREGEGERFAKCIEKQPQNRKLLWHGSRVSNYVGILSQGLRIAPPEAPKSGYRFGKGIYFADLCDKSIGYCRGAGSDYILMMLVEVALGDIKELTQDQYMEAALPGSHSTKAMGSIAPDPKLDMKMDSGCVVPLGPRVNTGIRSSCMHNEYIVYTLPQATIRYLLKVKVTG